MKTNNDIEFCDIFAQLSEFFKEPTVEFADDVASGRLRSFFEEVFASHETEESSMLNGLSVSGDVYTILEEEYRRLFVGPMPPYIVPVESVYKRWSNDPECKLPIAAEKGYLMGDPAMDMIRRYQTHDIVIPDKYSSIPDHIALELEYMAYLFINGVHDEQKEFLASHLDWVDDLTRNIRNFKESSKFYAAGAEVTALIISKFYRKSSD